MTRPEGAAGAEDPREQVVGVILAGGLSRRMGGGDKALRPLAGRPILSHVIDRAHDQAAVLVLNTNSDPALFAAYGLAVATFACDAPFLPRDLVVRLLAATEEAGAEMACATSRGRDHPVFGLWPVRLKDDLRHALVEEDIRKVDVWTARYRMARADFPDVATPRGPFDPFFNANRPEDLAEAELAFVP